MTREQLVVSGVRQKAYPQYIFKYRPINPHTEKIITDNELWFADPTTFNDPYDCNTPIINNATIPQIKKWLAGQPGVQPHQISVLASTTKQNPHIIEDSVKNCLRKLGICCFSKADDSILQWSHYADYHRGICLKFDLLEDPPFFVTPLNVEYTKNVPQYNHITQGKEIVDRLIKPKFDEWGYEREIRIVKNNGGNRPLKFNDSALKEIIFGTNTLDTVIQNYRKLCGSMGKQHVQFYKMSLGNGVHYELIKSPCP